MDVAIYFAIGFISSEHAFILSSSSTSTRRGAQTSCTIYYVSVLFVIPLTAELMHYPGEEEEEEEEEGAKRPKHRL